MHRMPVLFVVMAVFLLGSAAVQRGGEATAQEGVSFVGTWRVTASRDDGAVIRSITAMTADGSVITVGQPVQPSPPGAPPSVIFFSTGVGAWEVSSPATSDTDLPKTANVTFVHYRASADGHPLGTVTVRLNITLTPEQPDFFVGPAVATVADADGNVQAEFVSRVEGIRMRAEAPVMPDLNATPTT